MKLCKAFGNALSSANVRLGLLMLGLGGQAFAAADTDVVTRPIKVVNTIIFVVFALFYALIGMMWIWFPLLVIWLVYKHYNKKAQQGQEDVSGDMAKAMGVAGFVAIVVSFLTIGFIGNIFFDQGAQNDILAGIKSYYGNFMASVRNAFTGQQVPNP